MATLLLYVQRIISYVLEILGIVQAVQAGQNAQATAAGVATLESEVKDIQLKVNDSVIGLAAIRDQTDLIYTALTAADGTIEAALAAIQASLDAGVTVASISPDAVSGVTSQVWNFPVPTEGTLAYIHLAAAGNWSRYQSVFGHTTTSASSFDMLWKLWGDFDTDGQADLTYSTTFALDLSTILASDASCFDWASRVYPDAGFFLSNQGFAAISDPGANTVFWYIDLDQLRWLQLKSALGLTQQTFSPPVWPGLANVVLGTPVDISLSFTVDGPMDGVLVAIATYPTLKGQYTYDDMVSALKIGALSFVSDNGDAEFIQILGFLNEVYCPKSMAHASSCKVRTVDGVTGTITPWSLA